MKITDSPGARLVMPFKATALSNRAESSSIFQPVMVTLVAPVFVSSNQSAAYGLLPLLHGEISEMMTLGGGCGPAIRPGEPVSGALMARKAPLTPTALTVVTVGSGSVVLPSPAALSNVKP